MIATSTLLLLINTARPSDFPLKTDYKLQKLAEQRCLSATTFSHNGFWSTYSKLEGKLGYTNVAENLAINFPDAESAFNALENSPKHKKNNHSQLYQRVGISTCQKSFGNWFTAIEFAGNKDV